MPVKLSTSFIIAHHRTLAGLVDKITSYISDGWEPVGNPFWTPEDDWHWCQSLFKRV